MRRVARLADTDSMPIYTLAKTVEFVPDLRYPNDSLLERYQRRYENTCTKENGYILSVRAIRRILRRKLSAYNGTLVVDCEIEVDCLLPVPGQLIEGVVKQEFAQGWIVLVYDCMKVFVPRVPDVEIHLHASVVVEVTQIRFQKGRYDCIGVFNKLHS